MLQALSAILVVLLKYLLSSLVIIALMALENAVYYVLNSYLQSMLSNAYTCELGFISILYMNTSGSNMDRCH